MDEIPEVLYPVKVYALCAYYILPVKGCYNKHSTIKYTVCIGLLFIIVYLSHPCTYIDTLVLWNAFIMSCLDMLLKEFHTGVLYFILVDSRYASFHCVHSYMVKYIVDMAEIWVTGKLI